MWPKSFVRIPREEQWVHSPIEELARSYDAVENHGWYRNLDPVLDDLEELVDADSVVIDYSAGTGILVEKFFKRMPEIQAGFLLVDASPKFLRLALEKLGADGRTAYRLLEYVKDKKRLQQLDEVMPRTIRSDGVDVLCSTNAVHLYSNLDGTLESWSRFLKPGAIVLLQSGNIANPNAPDGSCIIDTTVEQLQPIARSIVRDDNRYKCFRERLDDEERTAAYGELRRKYFLPVRPLDHYLGALRGAGFEVSKVYERVMEAQVEEWTIFLSAYHDGVLGWAGGVQRIDGASPSEETVALRQQLLRESLVALFNGQASFPACWTYINCTQPLN